MIDNLLLGFEVALQPESLLYCAIGVFVGTFVGVLPGIGPMAAISILLPTTLYLDPTVALMMLAGVYYGGVYGGSTAAILMNIPGTAASAVTCIEGYPMARAGRGGVALFMTTIASWVGAMVGLVMLVGFSGVISQFALKFGPAEYFSVMLLGLVAASAVSRGSVTKGLMMVTLGALLGTMGIDIHTGTARFSFGVFHLLDGINMVVLAMGLFGIGEVINSMFSTQNKEASSARFKFGSMLPTGTEWLRSIMPALRGSTIGSFFGTLPGTGSSLASFIAYAVEARVTRRPQTFGKGAMEGLVAPETANNAAVQTAFIPTLTLGIPGDAVMALMLGALMMHGITPGPMLVAEQPELFWGLVASFVIGNILLLVLNIPMIGFWVAILRTPRQLLYPAIILLICVGVYSINNNSIDIMLALLFGLIGYGLMRYGFDLAPLLLGFILSPLMEEHFRRAMLMSNGDFSIFIGSPISVIFMSSTVLLLVGTAFLPLIRRSWHRSE